jgi:60 kDa SS-A/Ro ribonucleoprotein
MARKNIPVRGEGPRTHEGAPAMRINAEQQLRRSVMACMLWEDTFYETGVAIAERIQQLVKAVPAEAVSAIAIEAREKFKLRHVPLLLARELARNAKGKLVGDTIAHVIQRADELAEFLAIYWNGKEDKTQSLSAQTKKGLARAFNKFDAYQLAKYDRDGAVRLRDVMFLCCPKPDDREGKAFKLIDRKYKNSPDVHKLARHTQGKGELWAKLAEQTLESPDTWEVRLSAGQDKKATFEELMANKKLGAMALLRNLRNMEQAGIAKDQVAAYMQSVNMARVLPFRFIAAARAVPLWEDIVEPAMLAALSTQEKLAGRTAIVIDNSGSMDSSLSSKSDLNRSDAACALAVLLREVCEDCTVIGFGNQAAIIPARHGFALVEAIQKGPGGGTDTRAAVALANSKGYDRIIIVTDEQSHTQLQAPEGIGYVINVAAYKNGIGYGKWVHIDGWSEAVIDYIREYEKLGVESETTTTQ